MGNPENEPMATAPPAGYPDAPPPYTPADQAGYSAQPPYPTHPGLQQAPMQAAPVYAAAPGQPMYAPQMGAPPVAYPPGYNPTPMQGQPVMVTVQQPVMVQPTRFGTHSVMTICPHCQHQGSTKVDHESGLGTWLVCGGICLFGLWLGCCLIPFCINDLKDARHQCTNCKKTIKIKKLIS